MNGLENNMNVKDINSEISQLLSFTWTGEREEEIAATRQFFLEPSLPPYKAFPALPVSLPRQLELASIEAFLASKEREVRAPMRGSRLAMLASRADVVQGTNAKVYRW